MLGRTVASYRHLPMALLAVMAVPLAGSGGQKLRYDTDYEAIRYSGPSSPRCQNATAYAFSAG